jgi:hypothetical protein
MSELEQHPRTQVSSKVFGTRINGAYQTSKPVARTLLMAKITGANRDGDKRQSLKRPTILDTGSPENLISLALYEDLNAELIEDADNIAGIKDTELEVKGAATVYLTWLGESIERERERRDYLLPDCPRSSVRSHSVRGKRGGPVRGASKA